jgi:hypothetical protein
LISLLPPPFSWHDKVGEKSQLLTENQDLDTQDYLNDDPVAIKSSRSIFDDALASGTAADDNFLAIAHDIHSNTANYLVEAMLQSLQTRGYKAVTLGECLGDPKANWYRAGKS